MVSEKSYYRFIYDRLIKKNKELFFKCDEKGLEVRNAPHQWNDLYKLLDRVERNYEFNMQKMVAINYNHFLLWQRSIVGAIDINKLYYATQFVVFCCLADKILDSTRFSEEEKEIVCGKLDIRNFVSSSEYSSKKFQEMDVLLNDIRNYIISEEFRLCKGMNIILDCMSKAFESEIYMYRFPLQLKESFEEKDAHLLIDKSVQFEMSAFLMAGIGKNYDVAINLAEIISNIFWLIDDLCDFIEDLKARRKNSILFVCVHTRKILTLQERTNIAVNNIEEFIVALEDNLNTLASVSNTELYQYILSEVWEWSHIIRRFFD